MRNKKIVIVLIALFLLTGCTKQLTNVDGKVVKNETTGQVLPANILCQPTDKENIELYNQVKTDKEEKLKEDYENKKISKKEYDKKKSSLLDISKLPVCSKFKITSGGYEGLWMTIFIKPLTWFLIKLGILLKNYGLSIIITTLIIRLVLYPLTQKTAKQSEVMKKLQPEINKIEQKYKDKNDQQSMTLKSQELMMLYKKYNVNPMSGCIFGFLQVPLFFAFYESLYRLPALFEDRFLIFDMSMTPLTAITTGQIYYIILPLLVGLVTYFSFRANAANMGQQSQMKTMTIVMMVLILVTSFSMSSAIILYWITNSGFTIFQNQFAKRRS